MDRIKGWSEIFPQNSFLRQSRAQPLPIFEGSAQVWVKREDESGYGIPGNKLRKYASLIPCLKSANIREVALIGGAYSNHLAALPQLLHETGINAHLFLRGEPTLKSVGNLALIRLLNLPERLHWVSRQEWQKVELLAREFMVAHTDYADQCFLIPEGACMPEALRGAMTLGADIRRNELELGIYFQQVWIDSGTGMSAISALLEDNPHHPDRQWNIVLNAGTEAEFLKQFEKVKSWHLEAFPGIKISAPRFRLHFPNRDRFGKITKEVLLTAIELGRTYGLLMDPVYGVKLWQCMRDNLRSNPTDAHVLMIHSGGNGLWGNMDAIQRLIEP